MIHLRNMTIDYEGETEEFDLIGDFKRELKQQMGMQTLTVTLVDTDSKIETTLSFRGQVIQQQRRPLMDYEQLQYDPDTAKLVEAVKHLKARLMETEMELKKLKDAQGEPVEAGKNDIMLLIGEEFQGSLEYALEEAGIRMTSLGDDVFRAEADAEEPEFTETDVDGKVMCQGLAFSEHEPTEMKEFEKGTLSCPKCGTEWKVKNL